MQKCIWRGVLGAYRWRMDPWERCPQGGVPSQHRVRFADGGTLMVAGAFGLGSYHAQGTMSVCSIGATPEVPAQTGLVRQ